MKKANTERRIELQQYWMNGREKKFTGREEKRPLVV